MFTEKVHAEWMTCRDVVAAGRYPYTGRFGVLSEEDWKAVDEAMEQCRYQSFGSGTSRRSATVSGSG